jgi:hypothetical protein
MWLALKLSVFEIYPDWPLKLGEGGSGRRDRNTELNNTAISGACLSRHHKFFAAASEILVLTGLLLFFTGQQ